MKGRVELLRVGVGAFVLLLLGGATLAAPPSTSRFRASFDVTQLGDPEPSPRCPAGQVLVRFEGRGNATRMGRVSVTMSHCIIDDPAEPDFTNGEMVLTNVRGDAIFIQYSGTDTPAAGGTGTVEGVFTIVGGSGAYAGASGGGTLSGTSNTDGSGSGILTGTITLP